MVARETLGQTHVLAKLDQLVQMVDRPHGVNTRGLVYVADPRIDAHPFGERLDVTRPDWFVGPGAQHCFIAADVEECSDLEPIIPRLTALEPVGGVGRLLGFQLLERAVEALLCGVGHWPGLRVLARAVLNARSMRSSVSVAHHAQSSHAIAKASLLLSSAGRSFNARSQKSLYVTSSFVIGFCLPLDPP